MKNIPDVVISDDRWLRASVIGAVWGSFEIITGSFLHNLKIPFAGTIMAFFSVMLMSAFLQLWPMKGIIWRAGLIAALMKSLSPSAFLLGPMTGIFLEALFMELTISLLGINFFSLMLGGGLSLLSALLHKLANLLLLYGSDFITIYQNIISFAFGEFFEAGISLRHVLTALALLYIVAGILSAVLGFFAGRKIAGSLPEYQGDITSVNPLQKQASPTRSERSIVLLILHLCIIPVLLLINNRTLWYISLSLIFLYLSLLTIMYPIVFQRLKKPLLWLQLAFMLLLSMLFLNSYAPRGEFEQSGLIAGIRMNLRALLVIAGFAAIGFELRHEKIKKVILSLTNPKFYNAVKISFSLLPEFISYLDKPKDLLVHPINNFKGMIIKAESYMKNLNRTV